MLRTIDFVSNQTCLKMLENSSGIKLLRRPWFLWQQKKIDGKFLRIQPWCLWRFSVPETIPQFESRKTVFSLWFMQAWTACENKAKLMGGLRTKTSCHDRKHSDQIVTEEIFSTTKCRFGVIGESEMEKRRKTHQFVLSWKLHGLGRREETGRQVSAPSRSKVYKSTLTAVRCELDQLIWRHDCDSMSSFPNSSRTGFRFATQNNDPSQPAYFAAFEKDAK